MLVDKAKKYKTTGIRSRRDDGGQLDVSVHHMATAGAHMDEAPMVFLELEESFQAAASRQTPQGLVGFASSCAS